VKYVITDELKNMIWGNGIEEAEEKIRSDENFREKPYLLMSLVNVYILNLFIFFIIIIFKIIIIIIL